LILELWLFFSNSSSIIILPNKIRNSISIQRHHINRDLNHLQLNLLRSRQNTFLETRWKTKERRTRNRATHRRHQNLNQLR
jgi:hypothetical protein